MNNNSKKSESQLFFSFIDDIELRTRLTFLVKEARLKRNETQNDITRWINVSLTKIKEIEKGTCKDFNAINNYLNYFGECMYR